jgi:CheY-like chemotaxis protein
MRVKRCKSTVQTTSPSTHDLRQQMTKKILVVEDEPVSLKALRYFLSDEGYETAGAKDGLEAMELLAQSRFDLVISDVKMPRMDGVALARQILCSLPITPIFLVTANVSDNREAILGVGVPCLSKAAFVESVAVGYSDGAWATTGATKLSINRALTTFKNT